MAVQDIGINSSRYPDSYGYRIKDGARAVDLYLTWSTDSGIEWSATFVFKVQYRGVPKGTVGTGERGNTQWSAWSERRISSSSCSPRTISNSDRTWWSVPIGNLVPETVINGGSWVYDRRVYDQVQIRVSVYSEYYPGTIDAYGNSFSPTTTSDVWVGYFPDYTITDIYQQGSQLIITYTADGWTRTDDRYEILSLKSGSRNMLASGTWGTQSGAVKKMGWIAIPTSALQYLPAAGSSVYAKIRWNASYREFGMEFADASATIKLSDKTEANTPIGSVTVNPDSSISVGVGDSGDKGNSIYEAIVKVEGDGFEFDQVVVDTVDMANALLNFPPLGKEITVQIQGTTATGGVSNIVEKKVFVPADGKALIDAFDQNGNRVGEQCQLDANLDWSVKRSRNFDTVKLAGRKRPSAFFGEGGDTSISLSGIVFWKGLAKFDADRFYALGEADMVVIRFPDGQRFVSVIDSITTSESASSKKTSVSISATEVE